MREERGHVYGPHDGEICAALAEVLAHPVLAGRPPNLHTFGCRALNNFWQLDAGRLQVLRRGRAAAMCLRNMAAAADWALADETLKLLKSLHDDAGERRPGCQARGGRSGALVSGPDSGDAQPSRRRRHDGDHHRF